MNYIFETENLVVRKFGENDAKQLYENHIMARNREIKAAENMLGYVIRGLEEKNIHTVWVEHGTANPNARGFWNKYFTSYA